MLLFILSAVLILFTSYFVTASLKPSKGVQGIIYLYVTAFALVILTIETLSLFKAITPAGILILNSVFLAVSVFVWLKRGKSYFVPDFKGFFKDFRQTLKQDKAFYFLFFPFLILILSMLFLAIVMPVNDFDGQAYHVLRSSFFVSNQNLGHFPIADIRALVMPINSEILYAWIMTFLKKDFALGLFAYFSFFIAIAALWGILSLIGEKKSKRFWAIFMFCSLAGIISQIASTQTDLLIGALIISSIYLYLLAVKSSDKTVIFMSSLAYAIAIGVKTPAIVILPAVLVFFLFFKNRKNILYFCGFLMFNFLFVSSYNYILNILDFSNPFGSQTALIIHKFWGGVQGFFANLIRYAYFFVDFAGFKWALYLHEDINASKDAIFNLFNISPQIGVIIKEDDIPNINLSEQIIGFGVLGFLVFIPCVLFSIVKIRKNKPLAAFGVLFLLCTVCLAATVGFMPYNIRFFTTFITISSPVMVYSYFSGKNLYKIITVIFAMYYMALVSTHLAQRPFFKIFNLYKNVPYEQFRQKIYCHDVKFLDGKSDVCYLIDYLKPLEKADSVKVGYFADAGFDLLYFKEFLESNGHTLDVLLGENYDTYDLSKYDIIITPEKFQLSNNILNFPQNLCEYKSVEGKTILLKTDGIPCLYTDKSGNILFNARKIPYGVKCIFMSQNFHLRGFMHIKTIELEKRDDEPLNKTYMFYVNKKFLF